jgi:phosphatidylserine decarboxylase
VVADALIGAALAIAVTAPLAWKWELGVTRVLLSVAALALPSAALVALLGEAVAIGSAVRIGLVFGLTCATAFAILAYRFYRDPERQAPERSDVVVSPADGEVIYVRKSVGGRFPESTKKGRTYELIELTKTPLRERDAVVVGIAMSFLDVHVNRAPVAGEVRLRKHFPGRFGSLGRPEMVFENERATTVIERPGLEVAVVQIASRLVRQILGYVDVGDRVAVGQRIGVIRLGSQVDVVLPDRDGVRVMVEPGERVKAGESVLAMVEESDR